MELFIRGRKLNISTGFITQSYFKYQKMLDETAHIFYYETSKQMRASTNCI